MLLEVEVGKRYLSTSGYLFEVKGLAAHAQDCSITMVIYVNLEPTFDAPSGRTWVLEESIFLKRFRTE